MRRYFTYVLTLAFFAFFLVGLTGCDDSPPSLEDFPIQGTMDSPGGLTVSAESSPEFKVTYQGLEDHPTTELVETGDVQIENLGQEGDPKQGGSSRFQVSLATDAIQPPIKKINLVVKGTDQSSGRVITDTVNTFASTKLSIQTSFTSNFISVADYEGDVTNPYCGSDVDTDPYEGGQRTIQTSGASTTISTKEVNNPDGSNGKSFLQITSQSSGGSVTIQRKMNLPNSDQFSLLVRSSNSQQFNLTLGFTEMSGGSETTHEFSLPVPAGVGWLKVAIPFSEISADFSPVDGRAGGDGPLTSVSLTADAAVSYAADEMLFGTQASGPRAELHDFELEACDYGPPFSPGTFSFTDNVASESDGYTARTLQGIDFFGYNQNPAFLDVDGNDVVSFLGKGVGGSRDLYVFMEGPGGFSGGSGMAVTLPADQWQRFEIPLSDLGNDPSALINGLGNFGFGGCDNCVVDDIKIMPK